MNREFMKKMVKAKKLEYEAFKEIMPSSLRDKICDFEEEALTFIKDLALEMIKDEATVKRESEPKKVKKIGIDFE